MQQQTVRRALPALMVFDLDACLWSPEMFELSSAPTNYDATRGGVVAGRDVVRLFPGAAAVLLRLLTDGSFSSTKVAVASSTTEPRYADRCLAALPIDPSGARAESVADVVDFRQIYPGSKVRRPRSTRPPCVSCGAGVVRCCRHRYRL